MSDASMALETTHQFILTNVDGRISRYSTLSDVPGGVVPITLESVSTMTVEQIGALYGAVVGINPKIFKTRELAIESLTYQVAKLPIAGPMPAASAAGQSGSSTSAASAATKPSVGRSKTKGVILLVPPNAGELLSKLAPQARECISALTEIAAELGSTSIPMEAVATKLSDPAVASRFKSRQDPMRVFKYYVSELTEAGFIEAQR